MKTFKLLSWSTPIALLIGTLAHADVITDWNNAALDAIRADHTAPPIALRSLAILHVAIYDAVNGIARTNLTWCKVQFQPVRRVKLLPARRHTPRS